MKNKTLSLFLSLSVSLSSIWRNLKNSKRKSRKKEGKEKRNPERPEFYISQRTLFPPRKKNCTLSTVRASHISTPILYANPNPNLTRPTQRIVWQRRVPSQTRGISLFQNSSRPLFRPTNGRIIVSRIHTHMRRFEKFEIRSWREETNPSVWETSRGGKSKGAW